MVDGRPGRPESFQRLMGALVENPLPMTYLVKGPNCPVTPMDTLANLMREVCREAVRLIPDAIWASVTVRLDDYPFTMGATDPRALFIDETQYTERAGPSLEAIRTDRTTRATVSDRQRLSPATGAAAWSAGIKTMCAIPTALNGRATAALNLYCTDQQGLITTDADVVTVLTDKVSGGLADYATGRPHDTLGRRLRIYQYVYSTIDQAIGILAAGADIEPFQAIEWLFAQAARHHETPLQAAKSIIRHNQPPTSRKPPDWLPDQATDQNLRM